uniref:C-type lectin domain family 4 member M-like n=1 Tax=Scatophagus argus TaxID=75038 RepID=UPI001ED8402F|nr:C-type lectin domain family 4 member M-like [Scatophagus argus]
MENRQNSGCNFDAGFNTLICEEDLHEEGYPPNPFPQHGKRQVSTYRTRPWRHCGPAEVSLALLAAVLLMVDIGLGVHYNNLRDSHLTTEDIELINNEMFALQDTYKNAIKSMNNYKKQLDNEMSRQTKTNWEFEHQTKRTTDYKANIVKMTSDIAGLREHFPKIDYGCKHCPVGWIFMNSQCYYFPFSDADGQKPWQKAREFCQTHGGDLAVIDSKEKENSTVNHLLTKIGFESGLGFWIGLRKSNEEGTWKWLDGTTLIEGYWMDGEPNNIDKEICVGVYSRKNMFKAWNDVRCEVTQMKWVCEKAPTSLS